jgi:hypothetical protein
MFIICQLIVYNLKINRAGNTKPFNSDPIDRHPRIIDMLAGGMI